MFYVLFCVDCVVLCIVCVDCVVLFNVCVYCVVLCIVSVQQPHAQQPSTYAKPGAASAVLGS
jgi:hypothetical protein